MAFPPSGLKKHGYKSLLAAPRISKITLNMGVGEAVSDKKILTAAMDDLKKNQRSKTDIHKGAQVHCRF